MSHQMWEMSTGGPGREASAGRVAGCGAVRAGKLVPCAVLDFAGDQPAAVPAHIAGTDRGGVQATSSLRRHVICAQHRMV